MSTSDAIAIAAAVISLLSGLAAFLSYREARNSYELAKDSERRSRMPALVFRRDGSRLIVANVGVGPAMNVVYAQGGDPRAKEPIALRPGVNESWYNPIHLRPIEPDSNVVIESGGEHSVKWEVEGAGLGLQYSDAFGNTYAVKASAHGMRIFEGEKNLPSWSFVGMPYLWHLRNLSAEPPSGPLWWESKRGDDPPPQPELDWVKDGGDPRSAQADVLRAAPDS
jgi:hypothetical protein